MLAPNKKLLGVYCLMFVISFTFLHCRQNETNKSTKTELRLAWWGTQRLHECTLKAAAQYQQEHPHVSITCEYTSWRDYWVKLESAAINRNLPDIIQLDYTLLNDWVSQGLLLPLDRLVKTRLIDLRHVPAVAINVGKVNDKIYGINLGNSALTWILDEKAFSRAGVPLPATDWTWDDFERTTINLFRKLTMDGFATSLFNHQICRTYLLGYDEWWYDKEGKTLNYSDANFINYLNMLTRLQENNNEKTKNPTAVQLDDEIGLENNPIITERTAMTYMWTNYLMAVHKRLEESGRKLRLHPGPRPKGGRSADYIKPTMFFSITRDTKQAREAARFIDWFINSVQANKLMMAERGVPISRKIQRALRPVLSPLQRQIFDFIGYITENGSPTPPADPEADIAVCDNIYYLEVVEPVMSSFRTPEEAARIFRLMATEVLARN